MLGLLVKRQIDELISTMFAKSRSAACKTKWLCASVPADEQGYIIMNVFNCTLLAFLLYRIRSPS